MKKNVSLGKQLQFVNLKMLVLTHLSFYSHVPSHPHPLNYLGWGWGAESTVASGDTRCRPSKLKPEEGGAEAHTGPVPPVPPPLLRPWTDRQVSPGTQSLACRTSVAGWRMTLTLSTTFLGTDVFQFLRKRKEGRRRKRLFPRTAVEWMVWGWGQSRRACRGLWALHHALWPSGPLPQSGGTAGHPLLTCQSRASLGLVRANGHSSEGRCSANWIL